MQTLAIEPRAGRRKRDRRLFEEAVSDVLPATRKARKVNRLLNRDIARFDLNPEIRKFRFPVLVACGRFDRNVAPVIACRIHQEIPGSQFVVFEKSGHMPFFEQPAEFVAAGNAFLSGAPAFP